MGKYAYATKQPVITVGSNRRPAHNVGRYTVLSGITLVVTCMTLAYMCYPFAPLAKSSVPIPMSRPGDGGARACQPDPENILYIFAGRWRYLRINFAYIYRSLRKNGGVLDRVRYLMIQYDNQTLAKLTELTASANRYLGEKVFELKIRNHNADATVRPKDMFPNANYEMLGEIVKHPEGKYFKMDDDIVYIHPGTFRQLIEQQNSSECFLHFGNIGGGNWRSSYIHQEMGVYDNKDINPKKLRFQFKLRGNPVCGWSSAECAQLALRGFLYHYANKSLDRFLFDGRYLTKERARYSINFLLLDVNMINLKQMLEIGPIGVDDEGWLTQKYSQKVKNPNCVVGRAFVVHFSYTKTVAKIRKHNFVDKFKTIAYNDLVKFLPGEFQTILDFNATDGP